MEDFPHYDTQIELILQRIIDPSLGNRFGPHLEQFGHLLESLETDAGGKFPKSQKTTSDTLHSRKLHLQQTSNFLQLDHQSSLDLEQNKISTFPKCDYLHLESCKITKPERRWLLLAEHK